jgi:ABC-type phosphate transport system permease subunit
VAVKNARKGGCNFWQQKIVPFRPGETNLNFVLESGAFPARFGVFFCSRGVFSCVLTGLTLVFTFEFVVICIHGSAGVYLLEFGKELEVCGWIRVLI